MDRFTICDKDDLNNFFKQIKIKTTTDRINNIGYYANLISHSNVYLRYNHIIAKESNIHGTGVFATRDIPKGKIITFYPANAIVLFNDKGSKRLDERLYGQNTNLYSKTYKSYNDLYTFGGYNKYYGIYGLKSDPLLQSNKLYLGHLLNDGIGNLFDGISFDKLIENRDISNNIFNIYQNSSKYTNADLDLLDEYPVGFIISSKDIKKGEEILTFYGINYWYSLEYPQRTYIVSDINYFKSLLDN